MENQPEPVAFPYCEVRFSPWKGGPIWILADKVGPGRSLSSAGFVTRERLKGKIIPAIFYMEN